MKKLISINSKDRIFVSKQTLKNKFTEVIQNSEYTAEVIDCLEERRPPINIFIRNRRQLKSPQPQRLTIHRTRPLSPRSLKTMRAKTVCYSIKALTFPLKRNDKLIIDPRLTLRDSLSMKVNQSQTKITRRATVNRHARAYEAVKRHLANKRERGS
jgi:hypothetical protein